jgi:hypothetical protein
MIPKLLFEIAQCSNFSALTTENNFNHPCFDIVNFQRFDDAPLNMNFQIPEPWNGDIINAPILIVSSNPSFSVDEMYPDFTWPKSIIADFFINRFKNRGPDLSWVYDNRIMKKSGARGKSVRYWSSIQKRVEELIDRKSVPGIDYCITELVHCKSVQEIGVRKALPECSKLFFASKNNISGACIIIAIGKHVRDYFNNKPEFINKPIIYLPAPNARLPKKLSDHYSENEIEGFRNIFNSCKPIKKDIIYSEIELPSEKDLMDFFNNFYNI